tara:strand:+ start:9118 stop:9738 length:621 start_codon:yes stop_codon:yes gene_type:complete
MITKTLIALTAVITGPCMHMCTLSSRVEPPEDSLFPDPADYMEIVDKYEDATFALPNKYVRVQIFKGAKRADMNPWILMGIASRESDFRHSLEGDGGHSFTMFQIHRKHHAEYAKRNADNMTIVQACVAVGEIVRADLKRFGVVNEAIAAYNAGPTGVANAIKKFGKGQHDKATTGEDYSEDVLIRARVLSELFSTEGAPFIIASK